MEKTESSFQKVYNRIIPIVIVFPVVFLILFIVVSMIQLRELNQRIEEGKSNTVKELLSKSSNLDLKSESYRKFVTLAVLEEESLGERYRQGHYSLASRTFKQFLGFFTGIIMIIVGSVFVLLKLKDKTNLDAGQGESWKVSLVTSSPGVAFGVVGAILISVASLSQDTISVHDSGLYLTKEFLVAPYFSNKEEQANVEEYLDSTHQQKSEDDGHEVESEKLMIQKPPQ